MQPNRPDRLDTFSGALRIGAPVVGSSYQAATGRALRQSIRPGTDDRTISKPDP
jgi:hypothetical protein